MESSSSPLIQRGKAALLQGDAEAAVALAGQRLTQSADDLEALQLRFYAARRLGRMDQAVADLKRILTLKPDAVWALVDLSTELYRQGQVMEALRHARQALRLSPLDDRAHFLMGSLLTESGDTPAGEWHYRRVLEIAGPRGSVLANLAHNLMNQGRHEESEATFAEAARLEPDNSATFVSWARLYEVQGDLTRALDLLDRAETAKSLHSRAGIDLVRATALARLGRSEEALELLHRNSGDNGHDGLSGGHQLERGRLFDRLGRFDEAWSDFVQAKRRLSKALDRPYDPNAVAGWVQRLAGFFSGTNLKLLPHAERRRDGPRPIFILGFPRSGTTMIEQVLSSHSKVRAGDELTFIPEASQLAPQVLSSPFPFPEALADTWMGDRRFGPDVLREYYLLRAEQKGLFDEGKPFFTDKLPLNETYLPFIRMLFPEAKFVHVVRHPLDVGVSVMSRYMTHGLNFAFDIGHFANHYALVHDLVEHYLGQLEDLPYHRIRYEDFVGDQEGQTRRLLEFLDLPFEEACLSFHENRRYAHTASYAQVTEKLYDRSIGRHEHYARHLDPIRAVLGPAMERLGYA